MVVMSDDCHDDDNDPHDLSHCHYEDTSQSDGSDDDHHSRLRETV